MIKKLFVGLVLFLFSTGCFAMAWSGTAFFINNNGYLATAGHVVKGATYLIVVYKGNYYPATVVAADYDKDVAIVHINTTNTSLALQPNYKDYELVFVVGYPKPDELGTSLKVQAGYIYSITDDLSMNTYSCGGDSGGAIVNSNNEVVGILVAGYNMTDDCSYRSIGVLVNDLIYLAIKSGVNINIVNNNNSNNYSGKDIRNMNQDNVVLIEGISGE